MNVLQTALQGWIAKLYKTFIQTGHYKLILEGLGTTAKITIGALAIGVIIGLIIALVKYLAEDSKGMRPLAWVCDLYVTVIRGIPVPVLLLIFYYLILVTCTDGVLVATLTFGITSGAGYGAAVDLTRAGNLVRNNTHDMFNPLMLVALTYLIMVVILTKALGILERRLEKHDKR